MKTLITGASGNFGSMTVQRLLKKLDPRDLILMSRKPEKLAEYARLGCDVRYGDFDHPESLAPAARGAHRMLLISGHKVGHRIKQHGDAIEAARLAGVQHIVYTSYFGSDAGNTALVCIDHHGTEKLLKASGLRYTILRDGMYADSIFNAAMPAAIATGQWRMCAGDGKVNLVDRVDCVDSAVAVLSGRGHEDRTYNIVGPDLWSFPEMAALTAELSGRRVEVIQLNEEQMYAFLDSVGIPRTAVNEFNVGGFEWCSDDMISYERETRNGRFAVLSDDVEKLTGRKPKSFRAFCQERIDVLRGLATKASASAKH
ncbi:MAG: SDR family oxidoreductase [Proteobacteria bacterium]|nr:SDR family oxidoreductase [Pseudomonadota bacterium]